MSRRKERTVAEFGGGRSQERHRGRGRREGCESAAGPPLGGGAAGPGLPTGPRTRGGRRAATGGEAGVTPGHGPSPRASRSRRGAGPSGATRRASGRRSRCTRVSASAGPAPSVPSSSRRPALALVALRPDPPRAPRCRKPRGSPNADAARPASRVLASGVGSGAPRVPHRQGGDDPSSSGATGAAVTGPGGGLSAFTPSTLDPEPSTTRLGPSWRRVNGQGDSRTPRLLLRGSSRSRRRSRAATEPSPQNF